MKEQVIKSNINLGDFNYFIDFIFQKLIPKKSSYICFANVHSLMVAYKNQQFNNILNNADWVAPDGRSITIFLRLFNKKRQERIAGMDVLPEIMSQAHKRESSVYFYGSSTQTLQRIENKIKKEYSGVKILGMYSPPFRVLSNHEQSVVNQKINNLNPDLLLVSLGCPKQEFWMASQKDKINSCMLGLGQAFKTFSGEEKRISLIFRKFKWFPLELIFRLSIEPKRLWKRFLWTNSLFALVVLKIFFLKKLKQVKTLINL